MKCLFWYKKDLSPHTCPPKRFTWVTLDVSPSLRNRDFLEALAATVEIAERCRFDLPLGRPNPPTVPLPDGVSASQHIHQKAYVGAGDLYGEITPEIQSRLDHEFDVIAAWDLNRSS